MSQTEKPRTPAPPGYEPGECRRCKQPIFWATLVNAAGEVQRYADRRAKRLPLNRELVPLAVITTGALILIEGGRGRARFLTTVEVRARLEQDDPDPLYTVHACQPATARAAERAQRRQRR